MITKINVKYFFKVLFSNIQNIQILPALPKYYSPSTQILPSFYQNITRLLPKYYPPSTQILLAFYPNITRLIPKYYPLSTQILHASYANKTRLLPKYCPIFVCYKLTRTENSVGWSVFLSI